ncbi:MAG: hypothetical protein KBC96_09565 [Armatimonadetes bacterium]|nr:hypothetical protein [Armatimonadota bacterium]
MTDKSSHMRPDPEFERMSEECARRRQELAELFEEYEYLNKTLIPNIEATYLTVIGTLQYELLQVQIRVRRLRRKCELIQAALNRGEPVDIGAIENQLDLEFQEWMLRLQSSYADLRYAELRLSHLMTEEESEEFRSLFRRLVKKLHPDVNPDQSEAAKNLWLQVQAAYENGDLEQLRALALLAEDIPEDYTLPDSLNLMRDKLSSLMDKILMMRERLEKLRGHPLLQMEDKLNDRDWVSSQQEVIREQISHEQEQLSALEEMLKRLEGSD